MSVSPACRPAIVALCAAVLAAGAITAGCAGPLAIGTRTVRTPVFQEGRIRVFLRHREERGEPIVMGFQHPRTISAVRITRILDSIDVRERNSKEDRDDRRAAMDSELAIILGKGVSLALERATPSQEVVVMAVAEKRKHGLFTSEHMTSLVTWVLDDHLWIAFGELDERLSDDPSDKPREPTRAGGEGFRVIPAAGIRGAGPAVVAVAWRDPAFSKPKARRTKAGSRELRRTVLMEDEGAPDPEAEQSLTPGQLRALADLEERRLAGELSDPEYRSERQRILESGE